jgi:hypothetical protein
MERIGEGPVDVCRWSTERPNTGKPISPKKSIYEGPIELDRRRGNELGSVRFPSDSPYNGSNPCLKRRTTVTTFSSTGG